MKVKAILKILYMLLALAFMIYYLAKNWGSLIEYEQQFNVIYLLLAFMFLWLALASHVALMKIIFAETTHVKIGFWKMFRVFNLANLGRYLPGKLWSVMGMYYFTGEYGVSKKNTTMAVIANEITFKGAGLLLGICYLLFSESYREYLPLLTGLLIAGLVALHPAIIGRLINFGLKILKKEQLRLSDHSEAVFLQHPVMVDLQPGLLRAGPFDHAPGTTESPEVRGHYAFELDDRLHRPFRARWFWRARGYAGVVIGGNFAARGRPRYCGRAENMVFAGGRRKCPPGTGHPGPTLSPFRKLIILFMAK